MRCAVNSKSMKVAQHTKALPFNRKRRHSLLPPNTMIPCKMQLTVYFFPAFAFVEITYMWWVHRPLVHCGLSYFVVDYSKILQLVRDVRIILQLNRELLVTIWTDQNSTSCILRRIFDWKKFSVGKSWIPDSRTADNCRHHDRSSYEKEFTWIKLLRVQRTILTYEPQLDNYSKIVWNEKDTRRCARWLLYRPAPGSFRPSEFCF